MVYKKGYAKGLDAGKPQVAGSDKGGVVVKGKPSARHGAKVLPAHDTKTGNKGNSAC